MGKRLSPRGQRARRRERNERAFLFDSGRNLIAEFERQEWELALSSCGGDPIRAARQCGLADVPGGREGPVGPLSRGSHERLSPLAETPLEASFALGGRYDAKASAGKGLQIAGTTWLDGWPVVLAGVASWSRR